MVMSQFLSKKSFISFSKLFFILACAILPNSSFAQVNPIPITTVSAANYEKAPVAPESVVSAFGTKLST